MITLRSERSGERKLVEATGMIGAIRIAEKEASRP
jgi:hypothetical protein